MSQLPDANLSFNNALTLRACADSCATNRSPTCDTRTPRSYRHNSWKSAGSTQLPPNSATHLLGLRNAGLGTPGNPPSVGLCALFSAFPFHASMLLPHLQIQESISSRMRSATPCDAAGASRLKLPEALSWKSSGDQSCIRRQRQGQIISTRDLVLVGEDESRRYLLFAGELRLLLQERSPQRLGVSSTLPTLFSLAFFTTASFHHEILVTGFLSLSSLASTQ